MGTPTLARDSGGSRERFPSRYLKIGAVGLGLIAAIWLLQRGVVDLDAIASAGLRLGVDPLGGASVAYWQLIGSRYGLDLDVVNDRVDPTFSFMPPDHDGKIRMDSSSPDAMAKAADGDA